MSRKNSSEYFIRKLWDERSLRGQGSIIEKTNKSRLGNTRFGESPENNSFNIIDARLEAQNIDIQNFVLIIKQQLRFLGFPDEAQSSIQQSLQEIIKPPQLTQEEQKQLASNLHDLITTKGFNALIDFSDLVEHIMSANLYGQMRIYSQIDKLVSQQIRSNLGSNLANPNPSHRYSINKTDKTAPVQITQNYPEIKYSGREF